MMIVLAKYCDFEMNCKSLLVDLKSLNEKLYFKKNKYITETAVSCIAQCCL